MPSVTRRPVALAIVLALLVLPIHGGADPTAALLVTHAANPRFVEGLGVSRRDAVRSAISLWGGGALRQRARLRGLPQRI